MTDLCHLTGIVLAGGLSTRMGRDKASLPWGDSDLLHAVLAGVAPVCRQLVVVTNSQRDIRLPDVVTVADEYQRCGPLGGMHAGLQAASSEFCFIVACDMPHVQSESVRYLCRAMDGHDAVVPRIDGRYHPLYAVYRRAILPCIVRMLEAGNYRILDLYRQIRVREVADRELRQFDADLKMLNNVNTLDEWRAARPLPDGPA